MSRSEHGEGSFCGEEYPTKKDSKGKDLLGRRVPAGLTGDGKAWVTGLEGVKVRESRAGPIGPQNPSPCFWSFS